MRYDVLNLILGWTLIALTLPLVLCGIITFWLDDLELALYAFALPATISPTLGLLMVSFGTRTDTTERLRDREAFAAVALVWPIAVFIGSLPFWLGGVFVGPFTPDATFADMARGAVNSWFESMSGFTTTGATVISHNMSPKLYSWDNSRLYQCPTTWPSHLAFAYPMVWWHGNHHAWNDDSLTGHRWRDGACPS